MIRRDYILRMIEQLTQVLASVRRRTQSGEYVEAGTELDAVFRELTGRGADAVAQLSETELLAQLMLDAPTLVVREKTLILTSLLQEAGQLHAAQGRDAEAEACWLKALNLLLTIKRQDVDFEFPEFVPKIDLLRDQLRGTALPLQTLAALWRHYEAIGAYARAEDSLCALLEAEPDNAALVAEAKTFYERLLLQSDYALESGNLPRAEVEAGLAELTGPKG
jgi:tetratricopeptide (TPR) repeat protein